MSRLRYDQLLDGEWMTPVRKGFQEQCCGCGLVHVVDYRIVDGKIQFRATVDNRATAAARRKFKSRRKRIESGGDHGVVHIFNLANC